MERQVTTVRCPICQASIEAVSSRRFVPSGGVWHQRGEPWWSVKCANGHAATGRSLENALEEMARTHRR